MFPVHVFCDSPPIFASFELFDYVHVTFNLDMAVDCFVICFECRLCARPRVVGRVSLCMAYLLASCHVPLSIVGHCWSIIGTKLQEDSAHMCHLGCAGPEASIPCSQERLSFMCLVLVTYEPY